MGASMMTMVMLLAVCVIWVGPNIEHPGALVLCVVAYLILAALTMFLHARNFNEFIKILHADFDPQKILCALSIIMEKCKSKKTRARHLCHALCSMFSAAWQQ